MKDEKNKYSTVCFGLHWSWFAVARTKGFSEIRLQQLPMPAAQVFQTEIRDFFFLSGLGFDFNVEVDALTR